VFEVQGANGWGGEGFSGKVPPPWGGSSGRIFGFVGWLLESRIGDPITKKGGVLGGGEKELVFWPLAESFGHQRITVDRIRFKEIRNGRKVEKRGGRRECTEPARNKDLRITKTAPLPGKSCLKTKNESYTSTPTRLDTRRRLELRTPD